MDRQTDKGEIYGRAKKWSGGVLMTTTARLQVFAKRLYGSQEDYWLSWGHHLRTGNGFMLLQTRNSEKSYDHYTCRDVQKWGMCAGTVITTSLKFSPANFCWSCDHYTCWFKNHTVLTYGASATGGTGCILTVLHTLRGMHTRSWVLLDGVGSS